jgi:hypothetical protein
LDQLLSDLQSHSNVRLKPEDASWRRFTHAPLVLLGTSAELRPFWTRYPAIERFAAEGRFIFTTMDRDAGIARPVIVLGGSGVDTDSGCRERVVNPNCMGCLGVTLTKRACPGRVTCDRVLSREPGPAKLVPCSVSPLDAVNRLRNQAAKVFWRCFRSSDAPLGERSPVDPDYSSQTRLGALNPQQLQSRCRLLGDLSGRRPGVADDSPADNSSTHKSLVPPCISAALRKPILWRIR